MASIIPKEKDGKIISYKFKACVGRDDCGKQVFRCTTWKVPAHLFYMTQRVLLSSFKI